MPINIAIFASGAGSNAQKIIDYLRGSNDIKVCLIVCNHPNAGVIDIAKAEQIKLLLINKHRFVKDGYLSELQLLNIDFLILAGFLWKVPDVLIHAYPKKIINIHPALLPKFGGKGMYGHHVHQAVIAANETESGITIHFVDEQYDHGAIIFQEKCTISQEDTPETVAKKVHVLEHKYYPLIIEKTVLQ